MTPKLKSFTPDARSAAVIAAIERDGAAILNAALSLEHRQRLADETEELLQFTPHCEGIFHGYKTQRVGAMVAKSRTAQLMALNPTVLDVMDHFLLPNCDKYQLNLSQLIAIGTDERQQIIHPDDAMFPFVKTDLQAMINVMWAVGDFTEENGATWVAPGSHKWPGDRHPEDHELVQAEMPAGSCLIYLGSTRHGGGQNRTAKPRRGLVISYCLGWLRQSENQYLALPREIVQRMPQRLQQLVGYAVHRPNLGMVEGDDPIHYLDDPANTSLRGFKDFMPDQMQDVLQQHFEGKKIAEA